MTYEFEIPYYQFGFYGPEHYVMLAFPEHKEIWICRDILRQVYKVKVVTE